jgi:tetratricopeptide (TPR) repeat protein
MPSIPEALQTALRQHQAGNLAAAAEIYRQVLSAEPRQLDALHLLGLASHQMGRSDQALHYLGEALRLKPGFPEAHYNLGNVLRDLGRPAEAAASYARAVQYRPDYAEAHFNLGNTLHEQQQLAAAAEAFRRALECRPNYLKALNNLGNTLLDLNRPAEAAECYQQSLRLNANYAKGYSNLGHALRQLNRLEESVAACRRSLELEPENPEALNNLAAALMDQGTMEAALAAFDRALEVRPDYAEAHMNRAMAWLLAGDERGWAEYEWRWQSKAFVPRGFAQPRWDGSPPAGRSILVHAEQGLGDTLHFVRYVPALAARGGRVLFECPAALHRLLSSVPGIDRLLPAGSPLPEFEVHAPLLSLPYLLSKEVGAADRNSGEFRYSDEDRPVAEFARTPPGGLGVDILSHAASVPYLSADPGLVERWRHELAQIEGFKVGINWQGNPDHPKDKQRSIPLAEFLPLAAIEGVRLLSLQKGHGIEQLAGLSDPDLIVDLGSRLDVASGAFMDTAAVLLSLDLVITSDTALAHLAGALGVPVWVALPTAPDWRWQLDGDDTPWYPSMRLFRQTEHGDWPGVFRRISAALESLVQAAN